MDLLFNPKAHGSIKSLYRTWEIYSKPIHAKYINVVAIFCMAILIPFDFILFGTFGFYFTGYRVAIIGLCMLTLWLNNRFNIKAKEKRYSPVLISLITPLASIIGTYVYFLLKAPPEFQKIVFVGNLMVVFFCTFLSYRFWREQYLLNAAGVMSLAIGLNFSNGNKIDFYLLIIFHMITCIFLVFFRRHYVGQMFERYKYLCTFIPKQSAELIVISEGAVTLEEVFKPKFRYHCVLVSDWRNYQNLTEKHSPEFISKLFERFYGLVLDQLEILIPSGTYYVSWVADELFIVFYSSSDDGREVLSNALVFTKELATNIYQTVQNEFPEKLSFDVGLASGMGLLGLQGPASMKKTTVTNRSAGIAKRLEGDAKNYRNRSASSLTLPPVVALEKEIYQTGIFTKSIDVANCEKYKSKSKDISDEEFFIWVPAQEKKKLKKAS